MWQFADAQAEPRFLVFAHPATDVPQDLSPVPLAGLPPELRERLIRYGELRNLDDDEPAGVALAVQAPTREALDALLAQARAGLAHCDDVEIHDWQFGGRRGPSAAHATSVSSLAGQHCSAGVTLTRRLSGEPTAGLNARRVVGAFSGVEPTSLRYPGAQAG